MSIFRSEEMTLCQLFLQSEAAYACISELGELGLVQFRDLNPNVNNFQRKFVNEVRRCEEMQRKIRYVEKEIQKDGLKIADVDTYPKAPPPKEMIDLEASLEKLDMELREINTNAEALKKNYMELTELKEVLKKVQAYFGSACHYVDEYASDASGLALSQSTIQLGFIAGVILRERIPAFERMMWFACRGNVFPRFSDILQPLEDPMTGDSIFKSFFLVFYQGEKLKTKVTKICEGFRATMYPCPDSPGEREVMLSGVTTRLDDLNTVIMQTSSHRQRVLSTAKKEVFSWHTKVEKIKAIYHTLNTCNFDVSHNSLIAECWCPVMALEDVQRALQHGMEVSGSHVPNILHRMTLHTEPPTYFQTNKFTAGFQAIVDAYGVASYREVNPALFTVITFPFLFAVMFGDAGHGLIMFLFGLWMVLFEKSLAAKKMNSEIWDTFFGGRYIILFMGLFSMYTGLLYNDIYSKSCNIFGTSWHPPQSKDNRTTELQLSPNASFTKLDPYPFGLDPVWQLAKNKITFTNSFKMKLAVILGVSHMMFGVILSTGNHVYFKKPLNIICEFIPQVLFLSCIFGYLLVLIFYKWIVYDFSKSSPAPSLLIHLINMFLLKYQEGSCSQCIFYTGQKYVQIVLVVIAVICVPWMLLIKPLVLYYQNSAKMKRASGLTALSQNALVSHEVQQMSDSELVNQECSVVDVPSDKPEDEEEFGEVFIHQAIHTIEYCLGCISNTASYLRLWALSLAHAQLSEVLWTMVMRIALGLKLGYAGAAIIFVIFSAWAILTVAVLLVMEGLSAFLHALRLHWVEFQNKFYTGDGYVFQPFSFRIILEASLVEDSK